MQQNSACKLLMVEDNLGDADLARERLTDATGFRYSLHHVSTLRDAIAALAIEPFDAVILDLNLPDTTGIETLRALRRSGNIGPVIVLSGTSDEELRHLALWEGAQDFLAKDEPAARQLVRSVLYALERHRAQEQDRQAQQLIASNPDAVIVTDNKGIVQFVNQAGLDLFGKKLEDFVGVEFNVPLVQRPSSEIDILRGIENRTGEMRAVNCVWKGIPATLTMIRDITERKRTDAALRESEERFRILGEHIEDVIWIMEIPSQRFLYINRAAENLFGRSIQSLEQNPVATSESIHPEDRMRVEAAFKPAPGKSFNEEYRVVRPDGNTRWVWGRAFFLANDQGVIDRIFGISRDITDRKQLENQLRQSQKLEAIGRLAGGVAHDFNNLLTIINGYCELLLSNLTPGDIALQSLMEIRKAGERSAGLTRQLLAFSRQQVVVPKVLNLNELLTDLEKMLRRIIGEDVLFSTALSPSLGLIKADPGQIEQVVMNLVVNARDAMPDGGKVTVETRNFDLDNNYAGKPEDVRSGPYVQLRVSDTGDGMTADVRAKIFEPFFTTKGIGKGTGLGLAVVHGIVHQSGGHIEVVSEPGAGTAFKVNLPRVDQPAQAKKSPAGVTSTPAGSETILLVEDDDAVRGLTRFILVELGYTVLESSSGDAALRLAEKHKEPIHLLVTDVVMPGLGGRQVGERFLVLHPEAKVLYLSGYTDDAIVRQGMLHENVNFLQKPFTPASLAQQVRKVLDGHSEE